MVTEKLNADGHIESHYLPKKWFNPKTQKEEAYPVVNSRRHAKGDVFINADGLYQTIVWLPDALDYKGFIEKNHHDTCRTFERILIQAKRVLGVETIQGPLFDKLPDLSDENKVEIDMFLILKKHMIKSEMKLMIAIVDSESTAGNMAFIVQIIGKVQHAIENTQKILDDNRKSS